MRSRCLMILGFFVPLLAAAAPVTLPARAVTYRPVTYAWARVEPIAALVLRVAQAARVTAVRVVPGQDVQAGEPLVDLGGPQLTAASVSARARLRAARRELVAARRSEASVARTYPTIANRQTLAAAQAALAAAENHLADAQATLSSLRQEDSLKSPVAAVVSGIDAAPGADLPAGTAVLSLLPQGRLWLRAELFDAAALSPAAAAQFEPADGGPVIPVRAVATLPARAADGARVMNFAPVGVAAWQAGESGTVMLHGPPRVAVAVPAGALVLQAGQWFVLTDANGKLSAQSVTPGPAHGTDVLILAGLEAGVPVVVRHAYLLYHRDIAARYAPPD